jgi:hypothetical protein
LTTARYFSAYPSDPASRRTPCPPKLLERWLQVRLGRLRLSPACPFRLLHTFLSLRPARHYPRLWIQRSSSERRRDLNPPDLGAAQRTLWASLTSPVHASRSMAPGLHRVARHPAGGGRTGDLSVPVRETCAQPGSFDDAEPPGARDIAPGRIAFCRLEGHQRQGSLTPLNGWPTRTPVNASRAASRTPANDSGPMWFRATASTVFPRPMSSRAPPRPLRLPCAGDRRDRCDARRRVDFVPIIT